MPERPRGGNPCGCPISRGRPLPRDPWPRAAVHNLTYDGFMARSRVPTRCPAPLDSGFRRDDGGCAQHPQGNHKGRPYDKSVQSQFSLPRPSNPTANARMAVQYCLDQRMRFGIR